MHRWDKPTILRLRVRAQHLLPFTPIIQRYGGTRGARGGASCVVLRARAHPRPASLQLPLRTKNTRRKTMLLLALSLCLLPVNGFLPESWTAPGVDLHSHAPSEGNLGQKPTVLSDLFRQVKRLEDAEHQVSPTSSLKSRLNNHSVVTLQTLDDKKMITFDLASILYIWICIDAWLMVHTLH